MMSEEEIKKDFRETLFDLKNNYKTGIVISQKQSDNARTIEEWYNKMAEKNLKTLKQIKDYFAEQKTKKNERMSSIVSTILSCKQDGKHIEFNTNLFLKSLHHYILAEDVTSRCLTNDILNLCVTYNRVAALDDLDMELVQGSLLSQTQITSENFVQNTDAIKGYVQDYSRDFSCICANPDDFDIDKAITDKPNSGGFVYNGIQYNYFGDPTYCIVYEEGTSNEQIRDKFVNAKFIRNQQNTLSIGQKQVSYNNKLYYINKDVNSETFCPSFLMFEKDIKMNYLFDFEIDYNDLYSLIEDRVSKGKNAFPMNLCYWDTLNYCFEFLLVLSITSPNLNQDFKNQIGLWCRTYYNLRTYLSEWKENQLLLHRVVYDFMSAFLNNSEFNRFLNISKRINKYLTVLDTLKKHQSYGQITGFLDMLPFCTFMKNQMKDDVFLLAKRINEVIKNYTEGTKSNSIADDIRDVARNIQNLLPKDDMKKAAFPFIIAGGALTGNEIRINDPNSDPILINSKKNSIKINRKKKSEKKLIKTISTSVAETTTAIDEFLTDYVKIAIKDFKYKIDFDMRDFINDFYRFFKKTPTFDIVTTAALKYKKEGVPKRSFKKIEDVDDLIRDYMVDIEDANRPNKNRAIDDKAEEDNDANEDNKKTKGTKKVLVRKRKRVIEDD
jgi:hypothetical protein